MNTKTSELTDERAIELARKSIIPCKGITLRALTRVIELAEAYVEEHKQYDELTPMEFCRELEEASKATQGSRMMFK